MDENLISAFILNNRLTAVSAAINDENIFATDGINNAVYIYDFHGGFIDEIPTIRNYRMLRSNDFCGGFTALDVNCNCNRLYFLSDDFTESGYIELDTSFGNTNPCPCMGGRSITDASLTQIGSEYFIIGVFQRNAYLFDASGKRLTRLCTVNEDELLSGYISSDGEGKALWVEKYGKSIVTISKNDISHNAFVGNNCNLRMLFERKGNIYGLFGQSYIYNRIVKLYGDGIFYEPCARGHNSFCGA